MNEEIIKTPAQNNPESYVLTHNRFNTYLVLIFTDLNKAKIYKIPCRHNQHQEVEILMRFDYLNLFRPNEHSEDYQQRNENFLFEIVDKKYVYVGEEVITFETNDKIVRYYSKLGCNDVKYPYAYGEENIYFMLHQKHIPIQEYERSSEKDEYKYLYKKDDELKGDNITCENETIVDYGNDFKNCKNHSKQ